MADDKKLDQKADPSLVAVLAKLTEFLEKSTAKADPKAGLRKHLPLAPEHEGAVSYLVGPSGHYRNNRLYKNGEKVTVVNERPAKDWKRIDAKGAVVAPTAPTAPAGRKSDTSVGG